MAEEGTRWRTTEVEYAPLGRVGEREFHGVVERREFRLGPLTVGRIRPRAVEVYEPDLGRRSVHVEAPPDPYLRALRWTLLLLVGAWLAGRLARRRHTRS